MTNTTPTSNTYDAILERARELGTEHGDSAATWAVIENADQAQSILDMITDGDPALDDVLGYRSPLSGEWADGMTPHLLRHDLLVDVDVWETNELGDSACTEYEEAHRDAFVEAMELKAMSFLDED